MGDPEKIQPPKKSYFDLDKGLSTLYFDPSAITPTGDYKLAGGIVWPNFQTNDTDVNGFAVVCGRHEETGMIYIFEELSWITVEPIINPDKTMSDHSPISTWFNSIWSRYFLDKYYWRQDPLDAKSYRLAIGHSRMIQPKPIFVSIHWNHDNTPLSILLSLDQQQKLIVRSTSDLAKSMDGFNEYIRREELNARLNLITFKPVYALCCALVGLERHQR